MNLDCDEARTLLEPYRDGETDAVTALAIERHLQGCKDCSVLFEATRSLSASRRDNGPYYRIPENLRARLHASLPAREAAIGTAATAAPSPASTMPALRWLLPLAAGLVIAIGVDRLQGTQRTEAALIDGVVASHVRSLQAAHLDDVASTDQHTVKPWFAGKLDYSPPVHDLTAQGFPLSGGRLDYLDGRAVAALDYRRRQHIINVFVWPAGSAADGPVAAERNGYHLQRWRAGGMQWWAVSDLNAAELAEFSALLRQGDGTPPQG